MSADLWDGLVSAPRVIVSKLNPDRYDYNVMPWLCEIPYPNTSTRYGCSTICWGNRGFATWVEAMVFGLNNIGVHPSEWTDDPFEGPYRLSRAPETTESLDRSPALTTGSAE